VIQETPTIIGRVPDKSGQSPKTVDEIRICSDSSCDTRLSRYNTHHLCYRHRPMRFPRVRGRVR
jgi:hypothetical protein